jgi:RNA polymerase sigma-70 factor (ECF subfamily)
VPNEPRQPLSTIEYGQLLEPILGQSAAYARSIVRHRADAEDAVQQAALRGLARLATYDPARSFKAWWFAVLRHCCLDAVRSRRFVVLRADVGDPADPANVRNEDWEAMALALEKIPREQAAILQLRYFAELSYREIAESLNLPQGTVMSRLHYARKTLAAEMERTAS